MAGRPIEAELAELRAGLLEARDDIAKLKARLRRAEARSTILRVVVGSLMIDVACRAREATASLKGLLRGAVDTALEQDGKADEVTMLDEVKLLEGEAKNAQGLRRFWM